MDLALAERTVLVTGSTSGIGEGIAEVFAQEGARVVLHGRNRNRAEAVAERLRTYGGEVFAAVGSIEDDESAEQVFDQAVACAGKIEILINNVGIYAAKGWEEASPSQWAQTYNANVVSAVRLSHRAIPAMVGAGFGRIIQIASNAAHIAFPHLSDYAASKAALVSMTVSLAQHLAGTGVTANTVSPGPISTPNWDAWALDEGRRRGWGDDIETVKAELLKDFFKNPSGRFGDAQEIGRIVALLSSPLMGYANGANFRIDGGRVPTVN